MFDGYLNYPVLNWRWIFISVSEPLYSPASRSVSRTPAGTASATYFAMSVEGEKMTALSSVVFFPMPPSSKRMEGSGSMEREETVVTGGQGRDQKHSCDK